MAIEARSPSPAGSPSYCVVIPSLLRPSLAELLEALAETAEASRFPPSEVLVVDDTGGPSLVAERGVEPFRRQDLPLRVCSSGGRGPAAARNLGWRNCAGDWVVFLDDDVVPTRRWCAKLRSDFATAERIGYDYVAGIQGRIQVPLPKGRAPTDWERNVAGLERARWASADLAYRRSVLEETGGFDERFTRAFREDSDLALRVHDAGYLVVRGDRVVSHPVRPAGFWVSVALQAGNADDVTMRALHGAGWRQRCGAEPGRNGRHLATAVAALGTVGTFRQGKRGWTVLAGAAWAALYGELVATRMRPGPRTAREVATMAVTSVLLPFAAVGGLSQGVLRLPGLLADEARAPHGVTRSPLALWPPPALPRRWTRRRWVQTDPSWQPLAVLFDRDGTLVVDVAYNSDPTAVVAMPGAPSALRRVRQAGLKAGVVTNQSGLHHGYFTTAQMAAVNERVEESVGRFDCWAICPHGPDDGCACRKPAPGLVKQAAADLGVLPEHCVVIGDVASDVEAAHAAGARAVLVPTRRTRRDEIAASPVVAPDLLSAIDMILAHQC